MYSTCLFCHADLGKNEAIEHFPIGRRLAFDATRGRLWVVCRRCERWNLSPLEERWEAIEECERLFRATRLRVSTDNIGLARIAEGLELVRIGEPQRPEMAAWRYGDQFGRRRKRHLMLTGAVVAAAGGLIILGPMTGIIAGSSWGLWNIASSANSLYQQRRVRARLHIPGVDPLVGVRLKQLNRVALVREGDRWGLRVAYELGRTAPIALANGRKLQGSVWNSQRTEVTTHIWGNEALNAAGKLLPALNSAGARRAEVTSAVQIIGEAPEASSLFARYAAGKSPDANSQSRWGEQTLAQLPQAVRLALEMASHEESERRALEGELAILEEAWRQAEEIAAISDNLFVSDDTQAKLEELKKRS